MVSRSAHIMLTMLLAAAALAPAAPPSTGGEVPLSPRGAFFRSLLVPGWGQVALGTGTRAAVFGGVELAGWTLTAGFAAMKGIYRDDYRGMARGVAGANVADQPMRYFNDLAFYDTRVSHNQWAIVYDEEPQFYGPEDDWQWPDDDARQRYRDQLNASKNMDQAIRYALGVIAINHLASAIDAAKTASRMRSKGPTAADARAGLRLGAVPAHGGGVTLVVQYRLQ